MPATLDGHVFKLPMPTQSGGHGTRKVLSMFPRLWALSAFCLLASCGSARDRFAAIRPAVEDGIARGQLPGAVVAVVHNGETVYREAIGRRAVKPASEP